MIVKSITGKSPRYFQLLKYITNPEKIYDNLGQSFQIKNHIKNTSLRGMSAEFLVQEKQRTRLRNNSVRINHTIISFGDLDRQNLTNEKLEDMVRKFMSMRTELIQYVAVPHWDGDHVHVHIVSNPIEVATNRSLRQTKSDFERLKLQIQEYQLQKYPELTFSHPEHTKNQNRSISNKEQSLLVRNSNISQKHQIREVIEQSLVQAKDQTEFFQILQQSGLTPYSRGNKIYGVTLEDRNYRFHKLVEDFESRLALIGNEQEQLRQELEDVREPELEQNQSRLDYFSYLEQEMDEDLRGIDLDSEVDLDRETDVQDMEPDR